MVSQIRHPAELRRRDQAVVAIIGLTFWIVLTTLWFVKGGAAGQLVDIDYVAAQPARFVVDINEAAAAEFALLPGIGKLKSLRIVELRDRKGRFRDHDELLEVKGIGPKTMERMRPYLLPFK